MNPNNILCSLYQRRTGTAIASASTTLGIGVQSVDQSISPSPIVGDPAPRVDPCARVQACRDDPGSAHPASGRQTPVCTCGHLPLSGAAMCRHVLGPERTRTRKTGLDQFLPPRHQASHLACSARLLRPPPPPACCVSPRLMDRPQRRRPWDGSHAARWALPDALSVDRRGP